MPAGRPPQYRPEFAERAKVLCDNGATDAELAHEFGVSITSIKNWRNRYPEFVASLKMHKPVADARVERSLFERATGYTFESVKIFCNKDGEVTEVPVLEHVPPDPTSMIFWLKNRNPDKWRDKSEVEIPGLSSLADSISKARKRT